MVVSGVEATEETLDVDIIIIEGGRGLDCGR
jgi:hypothetical protein